MMQKHRQTRKIALVFFCLLLTRGLFSFEVDATVDFRKTDQGVELDVQNQEPFDVFLFVDFSLVAYTSSVPLPAVLRVPTGASQSLLILSKVEGSRRYSYRVNYNFFFADPMDANPDPYLYYFPYEHGTAHRVGQGWNGRFSHYGQNQYAVDFNMDEGTEVYAARDGVVVSLKEDSNRGGPSQAYAKFTNFVLIKHSDNTFANYVHLKQNGVLVEKGEQVSVGDLIALSGFTGVASGPHLHFDLRIPSLEGTMKSIPFLFRGKDDVSIEPKTGRTYYAYLPGGSGFVEVRGKDIDISAYEDFSRILDKTFPGMTVKIREENYDDRLLLFIGNGNTFPIEVTVTLSLQNLQSSKGNRLNIDLGAREERFLTVAIVQDLAKTYRLNSRIQYREISQ